MINDKERLEVRSRDEKISFSINKPEIYKWDKNEYCEKIFGTIDYVHPGVSEIMGR